jgi:F0F1-type ATP synthase membrane subunit a
MLPYGSPEGLMLLLPLIEVFSQIIRPFTLMIRLRTNLSSGHIMMYMFSFFSVSRLTLTFRLAFVLAALFCLEVIISCLQAYIFSSLVLLYINETLYSRYLNL